jgi:hypothetical protein
MDSNNADGMAKVRRATREAQDLQEREDTIEKAHQRYFLTHVIAAREWSFIPIVVENIGHSDILGILCPLTILLFGYNLAFTIRN